MNRVNASRVHVFAVGSDHCDDRVGWDAARLAMGRLPGGTGVTVSRDPLDLATADGRWDGLVIVDACRGAGVPGGVHRLGWPDDRMERVATVSSHGFGVAAALELAARLGRLPPRVTVLAVEIGPVGPGDEVSPAVAAAVPVLADALVAEVRSMAGSDQEE